MEYFGEILTDIGIQKRKNQDSSCLKIAQTKERGQVVMAVMCDGMGGLEKGELASAVVVRAFAEWFEKKIPEKSALYSLDEISKDWLELTDNLNRRILDYGNDRKTRLGTTLSAMLILDGEYILVHVGDSRIYRISDELEQLTQDHTFVAREIKYGRMTPEEAKRDPRRNALLQCIGASPNVVPDVRRGKIEPGMAYMLCTDGFYHVLDEEEICEALKPEVLKSKGMIKRKSEELLTLIKDRQEKDNITVAVIKSNG